MKPKRRENEQRRLRLDIAKRQYRRDRAKVRDLSSPRSVVDRVEESFRARQRGAT